MRKYYNQKEQQQETTGNCKKIDNYYYSQGDQVGKGNFSRVFRGVDKNTGKSVAIKVIKYSSFTTAIASQLLKNQINILKQLDHQNVIKCLDVFKSENNCYIVTQFYQGGDLQKLIDKNRYFQENDVPRLIYEIYKGLCYLNEQGIVHRDLKPANIFLDSNNTPKISDFGFAVKSTEAFKDINIGSPIYMSPEALLKREYGPKSQVWAFGILIYQMLHGYTPLSTCKDEKQLREKVLIPPTFRQGISLQLKNFIQLCMTINPKQRVQMKELSKSAYMSRFIYQYEGKNKDLTSTFYSQNSCQNLCEQITKQVQTYQDGLALLQYCRLIHKTTQQAPSLILSQWLLNMCWNLQSIKITGGFKSQNDSLISTIKNYMNKYSQQHKPTGIIVSSYDVISECQKYLDKLQNSFNSSSIKIKYNHLTMLLRQTQMLQKLCSSNKLSIYTKSSQIQRYLESCKQQKMASKH